MPNANFCPWNTLLAKSGFQPSIEKEKSNSSCRTFHSSRSQNVLDEKVQKTLTDSCIRSCVQQGTKRVPKGFTCFQRPSNLW